MITHIVLWKLREENKERHALEMKKQLLALKGKIKELIDIQVMFNMEGTDVSNFDVMLHTTFASLEDLVIYAAHPEHQKVVSYIKEVVIQRIAIDY